MLGGGLQHAPLGRQTCVRVCVCASLASAPLPAAVEDVKQRDTGSLLKPEYLLVCHKMLLASEYTAEMLLTCVAAVLARGDCHQPATCILCGEPRGFCWVPTQPVVEMLIHTQAASASVKV